MGAAGRYLGRGAWVPWVTQEGNPGEECIGEHAPWVPGRGECADAGDQGGGERAVWVSGAGSMR